jgi:Xaa-Pro dipeptidase
MQHVCTNMLKEGVNWDDVHLKAHTIAIEGLLKLGILQGDKEEILKARTSVAFFPHGLGHYLGMDTHDTGGHPNYQDKDSMFRYLRVRGPLPAGSIITVEPGVSSPPHINLDSADETRVDLFLPVHHRAISPGSGPFWIHQFRSTE